MRKTTASQRRRCFVRLLKYSWRTEKLDVKYAPDFLTDLKSNIFHEMH